VKFHVTLAYSTQVTSAEYMYHNIKLSITTESKISSFICMTKTKNNTPALRVTNSHFLRPSLPWRMAYFMDSPWPSDNNT